MHSQNTDDASGLHFANAAVVIVLNDKNELVLVRRQYNPFKGYWSLPGGLSDAGEKIEDTAIREVKEETGFDIVLEELIGVFIDAWRTPTGYCALFLARVIGGSINERQLDEVTEIFISKELPDVASIAFNQANWLRQVVY